MNESSLIVNASNETVVYTPAFLALQLFFAASMFLGCLVSYIGPVWYFNQLIKNPATRNRDSINSAENVIAYCNCFGAGIFVAICFLGMMPVVQQEFDSYFQSRGISHVDYPVAELFSLLGFFLVLFLEETVHYFREKNEHNPPPVLYLDDISMEGESNHSLLPQESTSTSPVHNADTFEELKLLEEEEDDDNNGQVNTSKRNATRNTKHSHSGHSHVNHSHQIHSHSHTHSHLPPETSSNFTFFVLMFATSIHSICEGLALGLIKEKSRALHLFIGIILHECIVAAALGLNCVKIARTSSASSSSSSSTSQSFASDRNVRIGILFSSTVPIGIIMGIFIGYTPGSTGKLISAIFQALAAGTFIHVAFCELIPSELSHFNGAHQSQINDQATPSARSDTSHETNKDVESNDYDVESSHHHHHHHSPSNGAADFKATVSLYDKRIFRIFLIFLGFVFMAIITVFIDH